MRNLHQLDSIRDTSDQIVKYFGNAGDHQNGVFDLTSPIDNGQLRCIASVGAGWEHVSVSRRNRCPNWPEMEHVKRTFFEADETTMQLHVPPSEHINVHQNCLHMWRPVTGGIPRPPEWMVA